MFVILNSLICVYIGSTVLTSFFKVELCDHEKLLHVIVARKLTPLKRVTTPLFNESKVAFTTTSYFTDVTSSLIHNHN